MRWKFRLLELYLLIHSHFSLASTQGRLALVGGGEREHFNFVHRGLWMSNNVRHSTQDLQRPISSESSPSTWQLILLRPWLLLLGVLWFSAD